MVIYKKSSACEAELFFMHWHYWRWVFVLDTPHIPGTRARAAARHPNPQREVEEDKEHPELLLFVEVKIHLTKMVFLQVPHPAIEKPQ